MFTTDGLKRLVMAELVREALTEDGDPPAAGRLLKVAGYGARELVRYPETGGTWTEIVDITWVDDADGFRVYEWRGTMAELDEALEQLVQRY